MYFIPDFKPEGDIDLIVSDGAVDLLIQLKRTYLGSAEKLKEYSALEWRI